MTIALLDGPDMLALRALRDLGVVRAPWSHPGFRLLRSRRFVSYLPVPGQPLLDFRLNDHGRNHARLALRPWPPRYL